MLIDYYPICLRAPSMPPKCKRIIKTNIFMMLKAQLIWPATYLWRIPVVMAHNPDGTLKFCLDYRELNKHMKAEKLPLPKIEEVIDNLSSPGIFSKLDMFSEYWRVMIADKVQEITGFWCKCGSFQLKIMHLRLINSPSRFQRMSEDMF